MWEDLLLKDGEAFRLPGEYVDALMPDSPRTQVSIFEHTYHLVPRWAKLADLNILMIMADQLRAAALGTYGHRVVRSTHSPRGARSSRTATAATL